MAKTMTINEISHVLPPLRASIGGGLVTRGSDVESGGTGFNGSVSRGSFGSGLFGSAILSSWMKWISQCPLTREWRMGFIDRHISSPHLEQMRSSRVEKQQLRSASIAANRATCRGRRPAAYCAGCAGVDCDGKGKTVWSSGTDIGGG
jgi:hypothetical protein